MRLGRRVDIADGVYQLSAPKARVTVLSVRDEVVVVDALWKGGKGVILGGLRDMGISRESVGMIVLTHCHPDHAGGARELAAATGAKTAAHKAEADMLEGLEDMPSPYVRKSVALAARGLIWATAPPPVKVDIALEDGQMLPTREPCLVVHTPGHTAGSISLFLPEKKLMIVGDALQYKFGARLALPAPAVTQDMALARRSIQKLLDFDFETIVFSHFPALRDNARDHVKRLLESADKQ